MDIAEKTRRINARCGESILTIARKECEALPSLLADDELPERILATVPRDGFKRVVWNVLLVATDRQVLCITTKETVRLAYPDIKSVAMVQARSGLTQGKSIEIVGPHNNWSVWPPTRQESGRQEADRFVSYVEERLGNSDALPAPTLDQEQGVKAMDLAEKTRRINARWVEINPKYGSLPQKEREALPSLLADDELPERILVAGPLRGFKSTLMLINVLLVATDRQVLCITTKETVRLTYPDVRSVGLGQGKFVEIVGPRNKWVVDPPDRQEAERFVAYVRGEDRSPSGEWRSKASLIDQQWNDLKPSGWGNMHSGEREMLYDLIEEGERMESLLGGTYRAEQDTSRVGKHNGMAVATNKRVLFVDKGVLGSTDVSEMPYRSIEAITYSTGAFFAGVQITGRGVASFRIEEIPDKDSVKPFVDCVRGHLEAAHAPQAVAAPQPAPPLSAADEIEKLASLLERGILTQEEFDAKKKQLLGL